MLYSSYTAVQQGISIVDRLLCLLHIVQVCIQIQCFSVILLSNMFLLIPQHFHSVNALIWGCANQKMSKKILILILKFFNIRKF